MYINRPKQEKALRNAVRTGYNIVIYGDSGCGKSWLYKKVFRDDDIYFTVFDFKDCRTEDDIDLQILDLLSDYEEWEHHEKVESRSLDIKPVRVGVGEQAENKFKKNETQPYMRLLSAIRKAAKKKRAFLVFENLEYAIDKPDVVERIRSMLLGLDDLRAGAFEVKICLVGVPSDIKDVLSDGNRHQTISNRMYEIPEVGILDRKSVDLLITRGLEQELEFSFESKAYCLSKIAFVTYQTPQYLHDVCLHVAFNAEDSLHRINPDTIDDALEEWIMSKASQSAEFIRSIVLYDRSVKQAKAKIIYAISRLNKHYFSAKDVNDALEKDFPQTLGKGKIQTLRYLRNLSDGNNKFLKCDGERLLFRVSTPYLRSCLRICLKKNNLDEHIEVKHLGVGATTVG
ncbi:hypothetical protein CSC82_03845 [Rhodobacteraceae bacterium 4F10]|nr:hypothetical protein CSC82_03845 [Rhodobacteraceae bacterium 4F10]